MKAARSNWLRALEHPKSAWEPRVIGRRALWVLLPLALLTILVYALKAQVFPTHYPWRLLYMAHDHVWLPLYGHLVTRFGTVGLVGLVVVFFCLSLFAMAYILGRSPLDGLHLAVIRKAVGNKNYHGFLLTGDAFGRSLGLDRGLIDRVVSRERQRLAWQVGGLRQAPRNAALDLAACLRLEWTLLSRQSLTPQRVHLGLVEWYRALVLIRESRDREATVLLKECLSAFQVMARTVKRVDEIEPEPPAIMGLRPLSTGNLQNLLLQACLDMAAHRSPSLARDLAEASAAGCELLDEITAYLQRAAHLGYQETPTMLAALLRIDEQTGLANWARLWFSVVSEAASRRGESGLLFDALERLEGLRLLFDFLEPPEPDSEENSAQQDEGLAHEPTAFEPSPAAQMWALLDRLFAVVPDPFSYQHAAWLSRQQVRYQQQQWQSAPILAGGFLRTEDFSSLEIQSDSFLLAAGPVHEYKHGQLAHKPTQRSGRSS